MRQRSSGFIQLSRQNSLVPGSGGGSGGELQLCYFPPFVAWWACTCTPPWQQILGPGKYITKYSTVSRCGNALRNGGPNYHPLVICFITPFNFTPHPPISPPTRPCTLWWRGWVRQGWWAKYKFWACIKKYLCVVLELASNVYCVVFYLYCIPEILKISLVKIHLFIFMVFGVCTQVNINLDLGFGAF